VSPSGVVQNAFIVKGKESLMAVDLEQLKKTIAARLKQKEDMLKEVAGGAQQSAQLQSSAKSAKNSLADEDD
jgi:hypothetical protein